MKRLLILLFAWFLVLPGSAFAQDWWSDDWGYRQQIAVDTGQAPDVAETVENAPVLVRLHSGVVDFTRLRDDGGDLRFTSSDGTPLDFHLEQFNRQAEIALVWVKLPSVSAGSRQQIWVYYGNSDAEGEVRPAETYDGEQSLTVHFADGGAPADVTANANTIGGFTGEMIAEGLAAGGARFGPESSMRIAPSQSLTVQDGGRMSFSAWIKPAAAAGDTAVYTKMGDGAARLVVGLRDDIPYVRLVDATGAANEAVATTPLAEGNWAHLAVTAGDGVALYVDGRQVAQLAAALPALGGTEVIGANDALPSFTGDLDELWRANTDRSPSFLALAAQSQGRGASVVQVAGEAQEAGEAGGHNYVGILFGALTIDAWVVILILVAMLAVAIAVMIAKSRLIGSVERANEAFRADFARLNANTGLHDGLVADGKMRWSDQSTLGSLFGVGRDETRQRLAEGRRSKEAFALAPQSVAAIRAAMDARLAREGQRLNARLVLLTIAISGGPFLGLLGTVIGVMITFAGVAAAGDVNINAIAPGIAAALLATVAGLAVAIPALFGYNWLQSRIEKIETDNLVFVDELEKRIAETYRPFAAANAA